MDEKGYVQVYTGDGKGKTTAALGLAMRAVGAGKRVFIAQFVKGMEYSELQSFDAVENVVIRQYGLRCFIHGDPSREDIESARTGLREVRQILADSEYDVVILDEANIALYYSLFDLDELWRVISLRSPGTEVVITGRKAPAELIKRADLVTEMREVKHYYNDGVAARDGIEK